MTQMLLLLSVWLEQVIKVPWLQELGEESPRYMSMIQLSRPANPPVTSLDCTNPNPEPSTQYHGPYALQRPE
jgi:hypothetical protein